MAAMKRMARPQGNTPPVQSEIMARLAAAASGSQTLAVDRAYDYLKTGLVIRRELSDEDWRNILPEIKALRNSYQLIIGDWMAYGFEQGYEVSYQAMAALTGLQPQTVEVFTSVCRNVPQLTRVNSLSFKHYRLIAPLPQDEQPHWIDFAVSHNLSSRSLADWIQRSKTNPQLPAELSPEEYTAQLQAGMPDGVTVEYMGTLGYAPALSDEIDQAAIEKIAARPVKEVKKTFREFTRHIETDTLQDMPRGDLYALLVYVQDKYNQRRKMGG